MQPEADPVLLASYTVDAIQDIARQLTDYGADIVALQEVQGTESANQAAEIAQAAGYDYVLFDIISPSHFDENQQLGHAILSKFPLSNHVSELFINPDIEVELEGGGNAKTFDKGYTVCTADYNGTSILVMTLHLVPFHRLGLDLPSAGANEILSDVSQKLNQHIHARTVLLGDFNIDDSEVLKYLELDDSLEEVGIDSATTPKGKKFDHIIYSGLTHKSTLIDSSVATDHYPVVCEFSID